MTTPASGLNNLATAHGPAANGRKQVARYRSMRRILKRAADLAMRYDDSAAAANEALAILYAERLWRFELLRSRQRQPVLIVPEPLPDSASNGSNVRA